MNRLTTYCFRLVCGLSAVALLTTTAWGIPASSNFGNPSTETNHELQTLPGGSGWEIGTETNPIPVDLDPGAGPWIKNLQGFGGQGVNADDTGVLFPSSYQLIEHLVIGGQTSWTDWHEEVLTPGWNIGGQIQANGAPVPGLTVELMNTDWPNTGGAVWFFFDPLPPGTLIDIWKQLSWVGDPQVNGNLFLNGVIQVAEYPTPEPVTAILFGLGMVTLSLSRRRLPTCC